MTPTQAINLINAGGTDNLRRKIKKYGIPERMKFLKGCIPYIKSSNKSLKFFRDHFAIEIGSLITAEEDIDKAVKLYQGSKSRKR